MIAKKKLGIIGGMGSRAGAFFLKKIIDYSPAEADQEFLEIIFHNNAATPDRTRAIIYNEPSPLDDLLRSVDLFNRNQVEAIALSCITSYYYYPQISTHTAAKVLNPLHLVAEYIQEEYSFARRIGLLATTGTINTGLFHKALQNIKAEVVTLQHENQETLFMRSVYMKNGFKSAVISAYARELMNRCIDKLMERKVDVIIGGCTEVSVAMDGEYISIPYVDSLDLLARKTVNYCYNINSGV
jgi:aspartate racemase